MKRNHIITLIISFCAVSCGGLDPDDPFQWGFDPWGQGQGTGTTAEPLYSGITGSKTFEIVKDEEDSIANTKFKRTIRITFSDSAGASVEGDKNGIVSIDGNKVTADNTGTTEKVQYELTGSTSNGYFKIYSNNKQAIVLDGVSITNPSGAAINNQCKKRSFVVVNGTNKLNDGANYTQTPENEDEKAAFFSEGQVIFSGDGTLVVNAVGKAGITSDDYLHFMGSPTISVKSTVGHAIRGKDAVIVSDGTLNLEATANMKKGIASDSLVVFTGGKTTIKVSGGTAYDDEDKEYKAASGIKSDQFFVMAGGKLDITSTGQGAKGINTDKDAYFQGGELRIQVSGTKFNGTDTKSAKGVKVDGNIYISDGELIVTSANHEAVEAEGRVEITGGTLYAKAKDDAINSGGEMAITGGRVCAWSTGNDGLDANGNLFLEGGILYAVGSRTPEVGVDANTEKGFRLYVNGGTLFVIGGLENSSVLSQACYQANSWKASTWYALTVGEETIAFKTPDSGGSGLVVSGSAQPTLSSGVSVSGGNSFFEGVAVSGGSVTGGSAVTLSAYSGGQGFPGGPGGGPGRP